MNLMPRTLSLFAAGLLTLTIAGSALAQSSEPKAAEQKAAEPSAEPRPDYSQFVIKTHYLTNVSQQNDANEILIALRNMLEPL